MTPGSKLHTVWLACRDHGAVTIRDVARRLDPALGAIDDHGTAVRVALLMAWLVREGWLVQVTPNRWCNARTAPSMMRARGTTPLRQPLRAGHPSTTIGV